MEEGSASAESVTTTAKAEESVNTPETEEASQASANGEKETEAQKRIRTLANQSRQQKKELEDLKKSSAQALEFYKAVAGSGPEKIRKVMDLIAAKEEAEKQQDPYAEFDPAAAQVFREWNEFKQWLSQQAETQKQQTEVSIQENFSKIENLYQKKLVKDGFLKDGKEVSPRLSVVLDRATRSFLDEIAKDPKYPTSEELDKAYEMAKEGILEAEKRGSFKGIKPVGVPLSGSKFGTPATATKKETSKERVERIASTYL